MFGRKIIFEMGLHFPEIVSAVKIKNRSENSWQTKKNTIARNKGTVDTIYFQTGKQMNNGMIALY